MRYIIDSINQKQFNDIAEIRNISIPTQVYNDTPFSIYYEAVNLSNEQLTMFGCITIDNQIVNESIWVQAVPAGNNVNHSVVLALSKTSGGQIIIGHVEPNEICNWIDSKGGPDGLSLTDVFEIIDSYVYQTPPAGFSFIPTITEVFGVMDYYLGFDGDTATGCNYYS